jgi:hypothetical protein
MAVAGAAAGALALTACGDGNGDGNGNGAPGRDGPRPAGDAQVLDIGDTATYEYDVDGGTAVYKVTLRDVDVHLDPARGGPGLLHGNTEVVLLVEHVSDVRAPYDLNKEYAIDTETDFRHGDIVYASEDQLTDPGPGQKKIVNLEYPLPRYLGKGDQIVYVTFDEETFSEPDAFAVRITEDGNG